LKADKGTKNETCVRVRADMQIIEKTEKKKPFASPQNKCEFGGVAWGHVYTSGPFVHSFSIVALNLPTAD
jgi:hypothetical protein